MKPFKYFLVGALVIIVAVVFVRVAIVERETSRELAPANLTRSVDGPQTEREDRAVPIVDLTPSPVREAETVLLDPPSPPPVDKPPAPPEAAASPPQVPPQPLRPQSDQAVPVDAVAYYQMARESLSWVGADPDAEDYWIGAINDPAFSAKQRQDLIEDMNEEGFANPKKPAWEELPLIVNRIQLIEDIAADAMDEINAAAFQEAHKDLVNMFLRLTR